MIISSSAFICVKLSAGFKRFSSREKASSGEIEEKMFFVERKPNAFSTVCQSNKKELDIWRMRLELSFYFKNSKRKHKLLKEITHSGIPHTHQGGTKMSPLIHLYGGQSTEIRLHFRLCILWTF